MDHPDTIRRFYLEHIAGAKIEGNILTGPCPFCAVDKSEKRGMLAAYLDPGSLFVGYFRCLSRCRPGGFPLYFGKMLGIDPQKVPGYDPDR